MNYCFSVDDDGSCTTCEVAGICCRRRCRRRRRRWWKNELWVIIPAMDDGWWAMAAHNQHIFIYWLERLRKWFILLHDSRIYSNIWVIIVPTTRRFRSVRELIGGNYPVMYRLRVLPPPYRLIRLWKWYGMRFPREHFFHRCQSN